MLNCFVKWDFTLGYIMVGIEAFTILFCIFSTMMVLYYRRDLNKVFYWRFGLFVFVSDVIIIPRTLSRVYYTEDLNNVAAFIESL
jgi:uncharacterized membrane protein